MSNVPTVEHRVREQITEEDWETGTIDTVSSGAAMCIEGGGKRLRITRPPERGGPDGAGVTVDLSHRPPVWSCETLESLCELSCLPENWDSYHAPRIRQDCIKAAMELILSIASDNTPRPSVVPTSRGTVLLEWHTRGVDLEIEILSLVSFHVSFEDCRTGDETEQDVGSNLRPLVEYMERLSRTD